MENEKVELLVKEFSETFRGFFIKSKVIYKEAFGKFEYSKPLFDVMKCLNFKGKSKMTDIGNELMVTKPGMTAIVDKLISFDLVYREHDLKDRRIIMIDLTEKGRKTVEEYDLSLKSKLKERIEILSAEEAKDLEMMLQSMKKLTASKFFDI